MKNSNTRTLLFLGLIASLGASISWNPEHLGIARYDMTAAINELELASRNPADELAAATQAEKPQTTTNTKVGEFDLGGANKGMTGIKVNFTIVDGKTVKYYVKAGDRCDTCYKDQITLELPEHVIGDQDLLQKALAQSAMEKFKDRIKVADVEDKPRRKSNKATSDCDEETDADQTACYHEEFTAIIEACDSGEDEMDEEMPRHRQTQERSRGGKRNACNAKAKAYFKKFLGKSIAEGLQAPTDSEDYQAAADARDSMISDLSPKFSEIRKVVVAASAQGVITRARGTYLTTLSQTRNETVAMAKAKDAIAGELYSGSGASLCQALTDMNCAMAFRNPAYRAQLESKKEYQTFALDYETSLKSVLDFKPSQGGLTFDQVLNGQVSSTTTLTSGPVTQELLQARTGVIARQNAQPVPGTGQMLSIPNSLPQATGNIVIPGASINNFANQQNNNNWGNTLVPGQLYGSQQNIYDSMNPTAGFNNGNYPASPAQRQ